MNKLLEVLDKLIAAFREKPVHTIIFTFILGSILAFLAYEYVHQPKKVSDGSQIIQSTGDDNKNSNSK
jgi:hypothetical protein